MVVFTSFCPPKFLNRANVIVAFEEECPLILHSCAQRRNEGAAD
jgi:hypothetical protein